MPNGRCIQGPDFHHDGQHYAKAYGIKFSNKEGKEEYAYQNTWAISTRMLGVLFAVHSDAKGLILPPKIAPISVIVVPILFDDSKEKVLKAGREIVKKLGTGAMIDERGGYSPGFKFNEWELKGIPIRIEIGPKDLENAQAVIVRRDSGKKEVVAIEDIKKRVGELLEEIQHNMFKRAENALKDAVVTCKSIKDVEKALKEKRIALSSLCESVKCEEELKARTGGKVLNIPEKQPSGKAKCIICGGEADYYAYVGRSY